MDRGADLREIQLNEMSTVEQLKEKEEPKLPILGTSTQLLPKGFLMCDVRRTRETPLPRPAMGIVLPTLQLGRQRLRDTRLTKHSRIQTHLCSPHNSIRGTKHDTWSAGRTR